MENKELEKTNWVDEMIQREALPKAAREETVVAFCKKWGISEPTYYYQSSKTANAKKELIMIKQIKTIKKNV